MTFRGANVAPWNIIHEYHRAGTSGTATAGRLSGRAEASRLSETEGTDSRQHFPASDRASAGFS